MCITFWLDIVFIFAFNCSISRIHWCLISFHGCTEWLCLAQVERFLSSYCHCSLKVLFSFDLLSNFCLKRTWCLFNNQLFHSLFPWLFISIVNLRMINNLFKCSKRSIITWTLVKTFFFRPLQVWLPPIVKFWVAYFIGIFPMIFILNLVSDIEFGLFNMVFGFKRINWSNQSRGISIENFIHIGPIFCVLFQQIQTLAFRWFIEWLLHGPIKLIFFIVSEFWKFSTMYSKNLISEFFRHIFDKLSNSSILNGLFIIWDRI